MAELDETQVVSLIQEIDRGLRARGIPIHRRAMDAVAEFQRRTGIREAIFGGEFLGASPTYSQRIFAWYDDHYGDRQKIDMSPGATLILIQGEPWRLKFPRVFGGVHLDILNLISDLPLGLRRSLTEHEKEAILATFERRFKLLHRIEQANHVPYMREARYDLIKGVDDVCKAPQNLPMAKWLFSQAAEKAIKGFIALRGGEAGASPPNRTAC